VREPGGIDCNRPGRGTSSGQESVHLVQKLGIELFQGLLEGRIAGSPGELELLKQQGVKVDEGNELTIAQSSVELKPKKNKQSG